MNALLSALIFTPWLGALVLALVPLDAQILVTGL